MNIKKTLSNPVKEFWNVITFDSEGWICWTAAGSFPGKNIDNMFPIVNEISLWKQIMFEIEMLISSDTTNLIIKLLLQWCQDNVYTSVFSVTKLQSEPQLCRPPLCKLYLTWDDAVMRD